jgi:hypothetical protein
MFGRLLKSVSPALKKAVAASAQGKKSAAIPDKAAAAPRGVVAKAVSAAAKQAATATPGKAAAAPRGAVGKAVSDAVKQVAGRALPFKKGGAVKKSSDAMGRAVKRKTADVKGRAMKKGK